MVAALPPMKGDGRAHMPDLFSHARPARASRVAKGLPVGAGIPLPLLPGYDLHVMPGHDRAPLPVHQVVRKTFYLYISTYKVHQDVHFVFILNISMHFIYTCVILSDS